MSLSTHLAVSQQVPDPNVKCNELCSEVGSDKEIIRILTMSVLSGAILQVVIKMANQIPPAISFKWFPMTHAFPIRVHQEVRRSCSYETFIAWWNCGTRPWILYSCPSLPPQKMVYGLCEAREKKKRKEKWEQQYRELIWLTLEKIWQSVCVKKACNRFTNSWWARYCGESLIFMIVILSYKRANPRRKEIKQRSVD